MQADAERLNKEVDVADAKTAELRLRIQALPDDSVDVDAPASRASLGRAFAASSRTARELRTQKLALGHGATATQTPIQCNTHTYISVTDTPLFILMEG